MFSRRSFNELSKYFIRKNLILQKKKNFTTSTNEPLFLGIDTKYTDLLEYRDSTSYKPFPIYTIIDGDGLDKHTNLKLDKGVLRKMYTDMVTLSTMDSILYESQRQGRISFYMTNTGEEAIQIGSASALTIKDTVYSQYRESGVLLWRGFKIQDFMNQCYGNYEDAGKGRQMPVHYGSKDLNFVTISSPLTTQLPQAVGAAYGKKLENDLSCVICYFGEGAASEGDAHAAFNFAVTLQCPIIFLCRNNGYAISTPSYEQFGGDGIAIRGPAYGMKTIRVDGNDVLAMHHVTREAREYSVQYRKPILIEAMSYRVGHHSTSDDSTAYRSDNEINMWKRLSPIKRFRNYLEKLDFWSEEEEENFRIMKKKEILSAFEKAELNQKPNWKEMFTDVYKTVPNHIMLQMDSMVNHVRNYSENYPLSSFK